MAGPAAVEQEKAASEEKRAAEEGPGWYPDPDDPAQQRYWDGNEWGEPWTGDGRVRSTGKANRLAVTALILSAFGFSLVGGILGVVFGYVALDEIAESEGAERGRGIAMWAVGIGYLGIALSIALAALLISALT